jgi:hypothetical protein
MKFFGNGIVWDKVNSKVLCRFKDGVYETDNVTVQNVLKTSYRYESTPEDTEEEFVQESVSDTACISLLESKSEDNLIDTNPLKCSFCGFVAKNLAGLRAHTRKCGGDPNV